MVEVWAFRAFDMISGEFLVSSNLAPLCVIERIRTAEVIAGSVLQVNAMLLDGNGMIHRDKLISR